MTKLVLIQKNSNQNKVYQVKMKHCKFFITNVTILDKGQQSQRDPSIGTPRSAHKWASKSKPLATHLGFPPLSLVQT
jgi:hypothetical protein